MATNSSSQPTVQQFGALTLTLKSDTEIELTRVFDAPRALVFAAHSTPEHMRRWWGPRGTTMVTCEMDFRPGGRWRYVLRKDNGKEYAFRGEYREIVAPVRLVQTFEFEGMPGAITVETLTFTERDGKTTLTVSSSAPSIQARDGMIQSGMPSGAAETYDRLEELLRTIA